MTAAIPAAASSSFDPSASKIARRPCGAPTQPQLATRSAAHASAVSGEEAVVAAAVAEVYECELNPENDPRWTLTDMWVTNRDGQAVVIPAGTHG